MRRKHMGSSVDDLLKKEGIFEEANARAIKEVVVWQLARTLKKRTFPKNRKATELKTLKDKNP